MSFEPFGPMWTRSTGEVVPISEMDDQHLANAIRVCEETFARKRAELNSLMSMFANALSGTRVEEYFEAAMNFEIEELIPGYRELLKEASRRYVREHVTRVDIPKDEVQRRIRMKRKLVERLGDKTPQGFDPKEWDAFKKEVLRKV
jgi:hypothetical protein